MKLKFFKSLKRINVLSVLVIVVVINLLFYDKIGSLLNSLKRESKNLLRYEEKGGGGGETFTNNQTRVIVAETRAPPPVASLAPVKREPRIFCFILTQSKSVSTRAKVVYDAWAHKCDNYKFIIKFPANMTKNNEIVQFASELKNVSESEGFELNDLVEPANFDEDKYNDLTNKVFLTYIYLYKKYNYYDWYLKADDDTFVFVDNMRQFLADKDPKQAVTYGYNFKVIVENGYHSGGAGYLLSNEALQRIGKKLSADKASCSSTGTEDVDVARCLRTLGVKPGNSTDSIGRERFHPLSIYDRYNGVIYEWLEVI
jgi:hypothetical protein